MRFGIVRQALTASVTVAASCMLVVGCSSSSGGTTTPGDKGAIAIGLSASSASIQQGKSASITATLTRSGGFTGAVNLTVEGAPAGVTGAITDVATSGGTTTATVTIQVAVSTAPGTYNLTVRGTGSGVSDATATFTLTVTAAPVAAYTMALAPTTISVAQGASGTTQVSLTRTNYTAAVNLTLEGVPAGVTGSFNPAAVTENSSTLTISVGASVTAGSYQLTVRGKTPDLTDRTAVLTLTVTAVAVGSYALSAQPTALNLVQGTGGNSTITIARSGGFAGSVALTVEGLVTGLTATLTPASTTGTSSTLAVSAASGLAVGNYTLTVRGTASGLTDQTTIVQVAVSAPSNGSGNVSISLSCLSPIWFAYQDGNGPWIQVNPTAGVYHFNITAAIGGFAYVRKPGNTVIAIQYMSKAQLTAGPLVFCGATTPTTKTINGTAAGLASGDFAQIWMGQGSAFVSSNGPFSMTNVADGVQDLVAYRHNTTADAQGNPTPDRGLIRRDQNIANFGSVGTVDFASNEGFDPVSATITLTGTAMGDQLSHSMNYYTGSCQVAGLYLRGGTVLPTLTAYGVPGSSQRASDFHGLSFGASTSTPGQPVTRSTRFVQQIVHAMADMTIQMPAALPTPTLSSPSAPYTRLQVTETIPADYQAGVSFQYADATNGHSVAIIASAGWTAGVPVTYGLPDFTSTSGWDNSWAPPPGSTGSWSLSATDFLFAGGILCQEGNHTRVGSVIGSY